MLTLRKLKITLGSKTLFEDASMQVNYGERVALVGPNGSGKSTLFSIILKELEPDAGSVDRDEWTMVGFLPQESENVGDYSVLEIATGKAGEVEKLEATLRALEEEGSVDVPEYYEAQSKYDALNDPKLEAKVKKMLQGLGYKIEDYGRPAKEMSGGWIMRAHLSRLLAMEPDLLMLDEPTNHLDLLSLLWLQDYLKSYSGAILMISHDREFMDEIVDHVHEIANQKLVSYKGNYSSFVKQRDENFERQAAAYKNQQKEIKSTQKFIDKFRSVSSKAAQAQSKQKELDRMELVEKPIRPRRPFRFQIPEPPRGGQRAITLENVHKAYGDNVIYSGVDVHIEREERTVLIGPNGSGKSTILKIMAGELDFEKGERTLGHNAKLGYYSQHRSATLTDENTVLEEVMGVAAGIQENEARAILGSFLFRKDEIYKKTKVLSGGEKSRLNLIKFLVDPPNLLLMDEPTTHLDILTVESLILALQQYAGTLVFISHDVHFIRKLATKVIHVKDGNLTPYVGGYDYYMEKAGSQMTEREAIVAS